MKTRGRGLCSKRQGKDGRACVCVRGGRRARAWAASYRDFWFFSCCSRVFFFSSCRLSSRPACLPPAITSPAQGEGASTCTQSVRARVRPLGADTARAPPSLRWTREIAHLLESFSYVCLHHSKRGGGCRPKGASFKNWIDGLVDAQRWKFVVKGDEFVLAPVRRRGERRREEKGCTRALVQGKMRHTLLMACFAFGLGGCW